MKERKEINLPRFIYPCEAKIIFDNNLNKSDKLLYIIIITLSSKKGHCFANNNYLAEIMNCSTRFIQRSLYNLKKFSYIFIDYNNGKRIIRNYMTICLDKKEEIIDVINVMEDYDWLNDK